MATFLEMCVTTMQEGGLTGSITSVVSQNGIQKVVVDAVATADYSIQGKFTNWKFLWAEWTQTLDIGANTGLFNEYAPPTDIGVFIDSDYATKINGNAITVAEFELVRTIASSVVNRHAIGDDRAAERSGADESDPDCGRCADGGILHSTGEDDRERRHIDHPSQASQGNPGLAIANVHAFNGDIDNYKLFMAEHMEEMIKLEADQLLGHALRTNASGEDNAVRVW